MIGVHESALSAHIHERQGYLSRIEVIASAVNFVRVYRCELVRRHPHLGGDAVTVVPINDSVAACTIMHSSVYFWSINEG